MAKTYSPWIEELDNGKYKYNQRYVDPLRSTPGHIVTHKVSVTLTKKTKQAQHQASEILAKKIQQKLSKSNQTINITIKELCKLYLQHLVDTNRVYNYRKAAHSQLKDAISYFGETAISNNITTPMINEYLSYSLYKRTPPLSNQTVSLKRIFLSNAYNFGIDKGWLTNNPVKKSKINFKNENKKIRERIENKYLTDNELKKILDYTKNVKKRPDYYDFFKFLYLTGMRISEAAALYKNDILKEDNIWIARVTGGMIYENGTTLLNDSDYKSKSYKSDNTKTIAGYRKVILNDEAVSICMKHQKLNPGNHYLFLNERNGNTFRSVTLNRFLKASAKKVGINKKVTSHFFRHTYISKLSEQHVPLNVIMSQVGHRDSEVTKKIYTHITEKELASLSDTLNKLKL